MDLTLKGFASSLRGLPMPELRKDPIVGRWVIIATDRAKRPVAPKTEPLPSGTFCPFCEGNEDHTPHEILAYRERNTRPDEKGWRVRVVPNKFPALQIEGALEKRGDGIYDRMNGVGAHEVILECPFHEISIANLSEEYIREILWVYRDRLIDLKKDPRLVYGMVFKNVGAAAGASLEHSHSQLIVTPIVPISVWEEMSGSLEFFNYRGRCIYCDMVHQELGTAKRDRAGHAELRELLPLRQPLPVRDVDLAEEPQQPLREHPEERGGGAGHVLKTILKKLETALDHPAYNYIIHTSPFDTQLLPHYHWHMEIIPRLTRVAGFEWGTGFYINPVPPEQAAQFLHDTEVDLSAKGKR